MECNPCFYNCLRTAKCPSSIYVAEVSFQGLHRWQLDEIPIQFSGDENLAELLTGSFTQAKRRGRPSGLSGPELIGARDRYIQLIENEWGNIGWDLPKAKSLADVRQ